jgi:hypothetical protein
VGGKLLPLDPLVDGEGVTGINTYVMHDNKQLFDHWKCGGKMKWFVQVRLDSNGGYSQIQKAVDEGAAGIHVNGDAAESILNEGKFEKIGEMIEMIKSKKRVAAPVRRTPWAPTTTRGAATRRR